MCKTYSILILFILCLYSVNGIANDTSRVKLYHGASLEIGAYHRGMVGLGYHFFMKPKKSTSYYGITASVGSKYPWVRPEKDLYLTVALSRNTEYSERTFNYGVSLKYVMAPYWNDLSLVQSYREFEDFTYGVFFGFSWKIMDQAILQPRLSYSRSFHPLTDEAPWYSLEENYFSAFGIGASFLFYINKN